MQLALGAKKGEKYELKYKNKSNFEVKFLDDYSSFYTPVPSLKSKNYEGFIYDG